MNPPNGYTLQELTHDVRTLIDHLRAHGVKLYEGIDFNTINTITLVTDGKEIDIAIDEVEVEIPPNIICKIRQYSSH